MIPLARWRCKIGSHTVQRERSEKATRRKGGRRQPLIQYRSKQALAESSNDTGPASPLPETAALQSKNGSFYGDEANRSQEAGRKPDSARRSSLGSLFTVQYKSSVQYWSAVSGIQQPLGGPIMCGEVHDRGDCRPSPQRADRKQQSGGKHDPNTRITVCLESHHTLLIWCIPRREGLANIMPLIRRTNWCSLS
jgi:hypothetical protein